MGDGPAGSGVIETAVDLTDLAIAAPGWFVAAESHCTEGRALFYHPRFT
jgi:hypothetical protein